MDKYSKQSLKISYQFSDALNWLIIKKKSMPFSSSKCIKKC